MFAWLGRTPHTHSVLLDVLLMALPGCWITASAALTWANERLDRSTQQLAPIQVDDTFVRTGSHSAKHYHLVAQWPDPRGSDDVSISAEEYGWIRPGTCSWSNGTQVDSATAGFPAIAAVRTRRR